MWKVQEKNHIQQYYILIISKWTVKGENMDEIMQKLYGKDEAKREEVKLQIYR